ncbi:MAG: RimK/LysX family protein [archaeon]|nr:RimK/LysX family protein [archaeon]
MSERPILGLIESVTILSDNSKQKLLARIDTGATSSSIDKELAEKLSLGPGHRLTTIRSATGTEKREIVKIKVLLNGKVIEGEFSIADRAHMTYSVLIGQNVLKKGQFLIDPLKKRKE